MAQQLDTASTEAPREDLPAGPGGVDVPTSPASLWASVSTVHYSITHASECDTSGWVDCDCVVHTD